MEPLHILLDIAREGADVAFCWGEQTYDVRYGEGDWGHRGVALNWGDGTKGLLADVLEIQSTNRNITLERRIGAPIREFLDRAGWAAHDAAIERALNENRKVRITVRARAAELYALPWELVPIGKGNQTLGAQGDVLIRYEWPGLRSAPRRASASDDRVLFAWSGANGRVPNAAHLTSIRAACTAAGIPFDMHGDQIENASLNAIAMKLSGHDDSPYTILHLLCHGAPIKNNPSQFGLALRADDLGGIDIVDGPRLAEVLGPRAGRLRLVVLSACTSGDAPQADLTVGGVAQELHRAGFEAVIGARVPITIPGSTLFAEVFYQSLLGVPLDVQPTHPAPIRPSPTSVEGALKAAASALRDDNNRARDHLAMQLYARAADGFDTRPITFRPYRGLESFRPEHARFFFGRDDESRKLTDRLRRAQQGDLPRFQVLAAESGAGKSSLVMAGVAPMLAREGWQVTVLRASDAPSSVPPPCDAPRLVIVDQLEELFTLIPGEDKEAQARRGAKLAEWWTLTTRQDLALCATLRVDLMGRFAELPFEDGRFDRIIYNREHLSLLQLMRPEQLRETIEAPARLVGLELSHGLSDWLLDGIQSEPGALPLLQFVLDRLWEARDGRTIGPSQTDSLQAKDAQLARGTGLVTILIDAAEDTYGSFNATEQNRARRLLVALVQRGGPDSPSTRIRRQFAEIRPTAHGSSQEFDRVLDALIRSRLVCVGETNGQPWAEIAHELLIRRWPRLATWFAEDIANELSLRELEATAAHWTRRSHDADRGVSVLLTGRRLTDAHARRSRAEGSAVLDMFLRVSTRWDEHLRSMPLEDIQQQGWGVVLPSGARGDTLLKLLRPLLEHRASQQGRRPTEYRTPAVLDGAQSARWCTDVYADPRISSIDRPRYLLLVGDLYEVPAQLQIELSREQMVGRLAFRRDEDYGRYAQKIIDSEQSSAAVAAPRIAVYRSRRPVVAVDANYTPDDMDVASQVARALTSPTAGARSDVEILDGDPLPADERLKMLASWNQRAGGAGVLLTIADFVAENAADWLNFRAQHQQQGALRLEGGRGPEKPTIWPADKFMQGGIAVLPGPCSVGTVGSDLLARDPSKHGRARAQPSVNGFVARFAGSLVASATGPLAVLGILGMPRAPILDPTQLTGLTDFLQLVLSGGRFGAALSRLTRDLPIVNSELVRLYEEKMQFEQRRETFADDAQLQRLSERRAALSAFALLGDPAARLPLHDFDPTAPDAPLACCTPPR